MAGGAPGVTGVLLAAGAGRRAGGPKALRRDPTGRSWLERSVSVLLDGGCDDVVVVLGSQSREARTLLPDDQSRRDRLSVVEARDWAGGMSRSLLAGLAAVPAGSVAALVHLVDLPDVTGDVVTRVLAEASRGPGVLARACFEDRPGHPVLVGREHLPALVAALEQGAPDAGARDYLSRHEVVTVECGDLAGGRDQDGVG
jgi:CTP:molybdopterin cytidylyltransferase MocA